VCSLWLRSFFPELLSLMMVAEKRKLQKKVVVKKEVAVKKTKVKLPESDSQKELLQGLPALRSWQLFL
jgi:hypothetical protein